MLAVFAEQFADLAQIDVENGTEIRGIGRCLDDLPHHRQFNGGEQILGAIVFERFLAEDDALGALGRDDEDRAIDAAHRPVGRGRAKKGETRYTGFVNPVDTAAILFNQDGKFALLPLAGRPGVGGGVARIHGCLLVHI